MELPHQLPSLGGVRGDGRDHHHRGDHDGSYRHSAPPVHAVPQERGMAGRPLWAGLAVPGGGNMAAAVRSKSVLLGLLQPVGAGQLHLVGHQHVQGGLQLLTVTAGSPSTQAAAGILRDLAAAYSILSIYLSAVRFKFAFHKGID